MAWVWAGALLMAAGGLWGAMARRRRPKAQPAPQTAAPVIVPTLSTP
jgi:cytochrome c-type biogenesis protein CcmF